MRASIVKLGFSGFTWREARIVCYRALLRNLVEQGLLVGSVDDMYDAKLHRIFMPHGIGHFIGGNLLSNQLRA